MKVEGKSFSINKADQEAKSLETAVKASDTDSSTMEVGSSGCDTYFGFGPPPCDESGESSSTVQDWINLMQCKADESGVGSSIEDQFMPPDFDDLLVQLIEKKGDSIDGAKIIESRYEKHLNKLLQYKEKLEGKASPRASAYLVAVEKAIDKTRAELQKVKDHLEKLGDLSAKETATWKDLNGDGKIGKDYKVVKDVYGREWIVDKAGKIISTSSFVAKDGSSNMDYCPELFSGDLSYVKEDGRGRYHLSADEFWKNASNGNLGANDYLGVNIPPAIWVKLDEKGEIIKDYDKFESYARCDAAPLDASGKQIRDDEEYIQLAVTDVEIATEDSKTTIKLMGSTPDGQDVLLAEIIIDPIKDSSGKQISAAGLPLKVSVCGDIDYFEGLPPVINVDASDYNPDKYTKLSEEQLNAWGIDVENVIGEDTTYINKREFLEGRFAVSNQSLGEEAKIVGQDGVTSSVANPVSNGGVVNTGYEFKAENGVVEGGIEVPQDCGIAANDDGKITTGIIFDYNAAGHVTGSSGMDVFIARDFSDSCKLPDGEIYDSALANFTRVFDGRDGENYILGEGRMGTLAADEVSYADIKNTAKDDTIFIGSRDSELAGSGNVANYQRVVRVSGRGDVALKKETEEDVSNEDMDVGLYEAWQKKGDFVEIKANLLTGDFGSYDPDLGKEKAWDGEAFDGKLSELRSSLDDYQFDLDPELLPENWNDDLEAQDGESYQELSSELDSFFSELDLEDGDFSDII